MLSSLSRGVRGRCPDLGKEEDGDPDTGAQISRWDEQGVDEAATEAGGLNVLLC